MQEESSVVIFGGTGFIGIFFAKFILENKFFDFVYLADLETIEEKDNSFRLECLKDYASKYKEVRLDVRETIKHFTAKKKISLIINLAAIHREPGHEDFEYFETNIRGAENVCIFAEAVKCEKIIFTSSISPYGISESVRDEASLCIPITPYGSSKLLAEEIHKRWQEKNPYRKLIVVRPGVVFGPSEFGNVSRMIKAVSKRYFVYIGNKNTVKAGIYVKELIEAIFWINTNQQESFILANMTMQPCPSIQEYVDEICKINSLRRFIPSLPFSLVMIVLASVNFILNLMKISHPFDPLRLHKLGRSNNIKSSYLAKNQYKYKYTFHEALEDWKNDYPEEWS